MELNAFIQAAFVLNENYNTKPSNRNNELKMNIVAEYRKNQLIPGVLFYILIFAFLVK